MSEIPGPVDLDGRPLPSELLDQMCVRKFAEGLAGWIARGPELRQQVVEGWASSTLEDAFNEWREAEDFDEQRQTIVNKPTPILREERDAFMSALSAAGEVELSRSDFFWIVDSVELYRSKPQSFQARDKIRKERQKVATLRKHVTQCKEAFEFLDGPPLGIGLVDEAFLQGCTIRVDLQSLLAETVLGRALKKKRSPAEPSEVIVDALADLAQHLADRLREWDEHYQLKNERSPDKRLGRAPNAAVHQLLHRLACIYEAKGGDLVAKWNYIQGIPATPFAKFLTLIYVAMPQSARCHASNTPSGFIVRAGEVLAARENGGGIIKLPCGQRTEVLWTDADSLTYVESFPEEAKKLLTPEAKRFLARDRKK